MIYLDRVRLQRLLRLPCRDSRQLLSTCTSRRALFVARGTGGLFGIRPRWRGACVRVLTLPWRLALVGRTLGETLLDSSAS